MVSKGRTKLYDLEERTYGFAKRVRNHVLKMPRNICVNEDGKQLIRSSGSVGANYIEANESLSKKDFLYRIKLCRKESKESEYWLKLIQENIEDGVSIVNLKLIKEAGELKRIFSSILLKSKE